MRLTLLLSALLALGWAAGGPSRGTAAAGPSDPTPLLVSVLGLAAWACAAYLLLVLVLTGAGRAPGLLGRGATGLARRVAPAGLRRTCELALGLTLAAAPGAVPAWAAAPSPASAGAAVTTDLDWPGVAGPPGSPTGTAGAPPTAAGAGTPQAAPARSGAATARPRPGRTRSTAAPPQPAVAAPGSAAAVRPPAGGRDRPSPGPTGPARPATPRPHPAPPRPHPHPASPAPRGRHGPAPVLVRPGDSLWSLAARALGPGATDRQVATSWPAWWSANRQVIGEDPDLLQPGMRLVPPRP